MLLTEVCHRVTTVPHLQPLSGESLSHCSAIIEDSAQLDVEMHGFWGGRFEKHLLMEGSSTLAPDQIDMAPFHLYIASMSKKREGTMTSKCVRLSMQHLRQ